MKQHPIFLSSLIALSTSTITATPAILEIDADQVVRTVDRQQLVGTNVSLWSRQHIIENETFQQDIRNWQPATIRMPGGSWSNEYYWNGNGVRIKDGHASENFNTNQQQADGSWTIDFSDYKKGFRLHGEERHLSDYHGDLDVKTQHEWINSLGSKAMVTVNVGSGSPLLATEWVKWANGKNNYGVDYWEVGNELNGDWELGHRLPDGSSMTGKVYAQRFVEFARSMRAADPAIKLGGPACSDLALDFVEELIRDGGEEVDFITLHAYPVGVNTKDSVQKFDDIAEMRKAIRQIHAWIDQYKPQRKDEIEIGITEWNIKVNEDRDTADLINGLWSAIWVGAMFEEGVDFANQWDLSTYVKDGGHGAFYLNEAEGYTIPKSQYWALWMWSNLMGDQLVQSNLTGNDQIKSFVTRSDEGLQLMLINTSENQSATVALDLADSAQTAQLHTFSSAEYFWDPHARKPLWSREPTTRTMTFNASNTVTLPKFSINVLQLPRQKQPLGDQASLQQKATHTALELLLPDRVPADRPIEAWVVAHDAAQRLPHLDKLATVQLHVEGSATLNTNTLDLTNAAANFTITPTGAGNITVTARSGKLNAQHTIKLVALEQREQVYWTFDNPKDEWQVKSTFEIHSETSVKPNQYVAAAHLKGALPGRDADLLFHFEPLPRDELPFKNASGVIGQLRAAHNLKCADDKARINIILQSDANHWMPIGSIPLNQIIGQWQAFSLKVTDPDLLDAMSKLYALRFQIQADAPVTGNIYLDDLGFIFRTGL